MRKRIICIIVSCILVIGLTACGKSVEKKDIIVFAASSLTESMNEIKETYEKEKPNVNIVLNLDSSSRLRVQIEKGVDAHIYLSANKKHPKALVEQGLSNNGSEFVKNTMIFVTPKDGKIKSLEDLTKPCNIVIGQKEVPAGAYALEVIHKLDSKYEDSYGKKVLDNIASRENNVKQVLAKVLLKEADGAFVYTSDLTKDIKDKVSIIEIPKEYNVKAEYGACILGKDKEVLALYKYIMGEEGLEIFEKYGFER
ncbi:MAG: molybdate ABC transporter substrate-binding protein [Anaeromicrobium sp.]|uniref:molybdate ABC transporter substrate-binding protein n=1 Tax=Anaeromicrobium sp. TaxID=1929132 RepID=UPI0025E3ED87|nr:molybdate ABC transporter substrate-binding protein [Anaeromicrobium sp.]MCT4593291.1 molybdate ABC transporter substrate-binding protein [Anaeromicrobium sp.]